MDAKKMYSAFCKSYWTLWISFGLLIITSPLEKWYIIGPLWLVVICASFAYLQALGKLVSHVGKRPFEWVGLTLITGWVGLVVSYVKMGRIAKDEGWA